MTKTDRINYLKKRIAMIQRDLDKIGFDTPLQYGRGTQRLGHAQKKRDGLAQDKFKVRQELNDLGVEL